MMPILKVEKVTKHFSRARSHFFSLKPNLVTAVKEVSLEIMAGESFGIVGESGSGKTTLANIIMGLIEPDAGEVLFEGQKMNPLTAKERRKFATEIQMVFQNPYATLDPRKTVGWSIQEPLIIHQKGTPQQQYQEVVKVLEEVELDESYYHRYPHELSGGQRQRIAIASAIILRPKLIVIDEGVSALDVSIQAAILNLLNELKRSYHLTYLFISHDLNVVEYFCDRVAVMYKSELVEIIDPAQKEREKLHPYTQKLFAAIPKMYLEEV